MPSPKVLKGVLHNFLGTYMSRYSDYRGYWLFGFLVTELNTEVINLLTTSSNSPDTPEGRLEKLAAMKFSDQLHKSGFDRSRVRQAWLRIKRTPIPVDQLVNGYLCKGFNVQFNASVTIDNGKHYETNQVRFVAPHDARIELRSARNE